MRTIPLLIFLLAFAISSSAQSTISNQSVSVLASPNMNGVTTGVIIIDTDELIMVAPNPAQNYFNLQTAQSLNSSVLSIYDLNGYLVRNAALPNNTVDVNTLANGNYNFVITAASGARQGHGSVIVQH